MRSAVRLSRSPDGNAPVSVDACLIDFFREQLRERCTRVGRSHERLADEKRLDAFRTQPRDVVRRANPAFGHEQPVVRNLRREPQRRFDRRLERAQVAIVDANQRCRNRERALELFLVVHFDEHVEIELGREQCEFQHRRIAERRRNSDDAASPRAASASK